MSCRNPTSDHQRFKKPSLLAALLPTSRKEREKWGTGGTLECMGHLSMLSPNVGLIRLSNQPVTFHSLVDSFQS